jgi:sterol-4alpha-carboxylate 3-dehydrogenase (decarboxylating)
MDGTVLITGGAGFLGSYLVQALSSEDNRILAHVAATYHTRKPPLTSSPSVSWHQFDLTDRAQAAALLDAVKPQVIIHPLTPGVFAPPESQYRINYLSTKYLLKLSKQHASVYAFVYISSSEAVGLRSGYNSKPETEDDAVLCTLEEGPNAYARKKGAADALVLAANSSGMPKDSNDGFSGHLYTTVLRFPGLYDPHDSVLTGRILGLAGTAATSIQIGPNKAVHEWLYVYNAVEAVILTCKTLVDERSIAKDKECSVTGQAFFITDGKPVKYWDFSRMIWAASAVQNRPGL